MGKVTRINIVTGVESIVMQEVWTLGAITFARKDVKEHTTMHMAPSMGDTNQDLSDMEFIMWSKKLKEFLQ